MKDRFQGKKDLPPANESTNKDNVSKTPFPKEPVPQVVEKPFSNIENSTEKYNQKRLTRKIRPN